MFAIPSEPITYQIARRAGEFTKHEGSIGYCDRRDTWKYLKASKEILMVNISHESASEVTERLERVIQQTRLVVYDDAYVFEEFPLDAFHERADPNALALVRDDQVWSQLTRQNNPAPDDEPFAIWRFHFPAGVDNSGFVGWLAMRLKEQFGTGVFVVCGQNSADGGIFDYWGCPLELRDDIIGAVESLVRPTQ